MRWTTDVSAKAESYLINGWIHWSYYGLAHLLCNFVLAILFQGILFQKKGNETNTRDNFATGKGEEEPLVVTKGPGAHRQDQTRWAGLDKDESYQPSEVDHMKTMEHDMRGLDMSTHPVHGQPSSCRGQGHGAVDFD